MTSEKKGISVPLPKDSKGMARFVVKCHTCQGRGVDLANKDKSHIRTYWKFGTGTEEFLYERYF